VPGNLSNVVAIATADFHSLALKNDGTLVAWGFNTVGQCAVPACVTNAVAIAAWGSHSMALLQDPSLASTTAPSLSITTAGGNVMLSWPASLSGFSLQQSDSLPALNWTAVTNVPTAVNGQNQVILPATGNRFFRLAQITN
jgi:hypothetical protein